MDHGPAPRFSTPATNASSSSLVHATRSRRALLNINAHSIDPLVRLCPAAGTVGAVEALRAVDVSGAAVVHVDTSRRFVVNAGVGDDDGEVGAALSIAIGGSRLTPSSSVADVDAITWSLATVSALDAGRGRRTVADVDAIASSSTTVPVLVDARGGGTAAARMDCSKPIVVCAAESMKGTPVSSATW